MKKFRSLLTLAGALIAGVASAAPGHMIEGVSGATINLSAKDGYINTADGNSIYCWGYASGDGLMQYPGPTIILSQNQIITINLTNRLSVPTSITFPGHTNVIATGGVPGAITREAPPGGVVSYSFRASQPGTYMYNSGTRMDLQVEMGLFGAIIVRPTVSTQAYAHASTAFRHEYLFLLSEIDPVVHDLVDLGLMDEVDTTTFFPVYWFINGRSSPDTMAPAHASWLPHQPYDCLPTMRPGEKVLLRLIGGGRDPHPFHHHGANSLTVGRDGRMLSSAPPGAGADLAESDFTITVHPGGTADAIFNWTGAGLGWDMYGHKPGDPLKPYEDPADHGKPFPVQLPGILDVFPGENWPGSPFLGQSGFLPPSQVNYNPAGAYFHMWHSHNEKEIVNNDIFPGGMMTMLIIEPW